MKTIKIKFWGEIPKDYTGAVEHPDGRKEWHLNGKYHRETGPCTTCKDCQDGNFELCSKPGPAYEHPDGTKEWFLNGKLHREDGPAYEHPDGRKEWGLNGNLHREDGPAIEHADGIKEWFLNGKEVDKQTVELFFMFKHIK